MNHEQKSSRRDHLTTEEGKIELTEEQLSRATGGTVLGGTALGRGRVITNGGNNFSL
jgi:hypothetical protein